MQIIPGRRDFLASAVVGRSRERVWHTGGTACRRAVAGDDDDTARPFVGICSAPLYVADEQLRARASPISVG